MNAVKAMWIDGKILPTGPVNWPEGIQLLVEPMAGSDKVGLDEAEWRDDPAAISDWEAWLKTIQPMLLTDDERNELERYQEEFRRFNLEAVRRQMTAGDGA